MCGIAAFFSTNENYINQNIALKAIEILKKRGPNNQHFTIHQNVLLVHTRLSIIDTSTAANQPFTDSTGRYHLIFNGEIFNFDTLKKELQQNYNVIFNTHCDTEVLLHLLIHYKEDCINKLNGFFSFCFFDNITQKAIIARDRYGVKPLYIYQDKNLIAIASEPKVFKVCGLDYSIDTSTLSNYFHYNYLPYNTSIFNKIQKVKNAHVLQINTKSIDIDFTKKYYEINNNKTIVDYEKSKKTFRDIFTTAVKSRLVSDVPLGSFLSGGIDSSVVTAIAAQEINNLNTFSIGFLDNKNYDESAYAKIVSNKYNTNHHAIMLSNSSMFAELYNMLDYIDEPFADSSALNVFILSKEVKKHVTVALSGDGADELLGGYNKHAALLKSFENTYSNIILKYGNFLTKYLPASRANKKLDFLRKIKKYSHALQYQPNQRYSLLAGFSLNNYTNSLLKKSGDIIVSGNINKDDFNTILKEDVALVLEGDMLVKVDRMSMANSLEVRNPFLDVNVVDYLFTLPANFKIDGNSRKKILVDSFTDLIPKEILNRPKHGFEIPLEQWLKKDLNDLLFNDLLNENFVNQQNIFNYSVIIDLKKQLHSKNPEDSPAKLWALLVFQYWYKKYII